MPATVQAQGRLREQNADMRRALERIAELGFATGRESASVILVSWQKQTRIARWALARVKEEA